MVIAINQLYCPNTDADIKYRWLDEIVYVYFARLYIPLNCHWEATDIYWAIMDMDSAQNQWLHWYLNMDSSS